MSQCQEYRYVTNGDGTGHLQTRQCRNQATATFHGINLCTVHIGSAMGYGKSWFLRDGESYELTIPGGPPYPLAEQEGAEHE